MPSATVLVADDMNDYLFLEIPTHVIALEDQKDGELYISVQHKNTVYSLDLRKAFKVLASETKD